QDPAVQEEPCFLSELAQDFNERPTETLAGKQPGTAIGGRGDELQFSALEMTSVNRHADSLSADAEGNVSRRAKLRLPHPASIAMYPVAGAQQSCAKLKTSKLPRIADLRSAPAGLLWRGHTKMRCMRWSRWNSSTLRCGKLG